MNNINKTAVLGGGGRNGTYIVNQLLKQGFSIKLLLRNPESFSIQNDQIEIIKGDALDLEAVQLLLQDCKAVISTVGHRKDEPLVAGLATKNILEVMNRYGIDRYILLAGLNIDTPFDKKGIKTQMASDWMKTNFPLIQEDRQKAYKLLEESTVSWTQVRVPFIEFTNSSSEIAISLEDCLGDKINAHDIAAFMIREMQESKYSRKSPFISAV